MVKMLTRLLVLAAAAIGLPASAAQDLLLEAQLEPAQVYVQSQAVYRLRLYRAVDVQDLQLAGPAARVADLRPIGSDRVYETVRDGRRYRVHERSYAVFPFASGTLQLAGAHASGRIPASGARAPDGRQPVRIDALPQTLTVLPAPAGVDAWLPAQALVLRETWTAAPAGALRRTIRIEATGVDAAQLPELPVAAPGITVRTEPAHLENRFEGTRNIGVREQSFIVAHAGAGDAVVPALQVQWWHTGTGMPMTASLPAKTLPRIQPPTAAGQAAPSGQAPPLRAASGLAWLALPFALLLGVAVVRYCTSAACVLQRACRRGDARAVRDGLLAWSAAVWPHAPPRTLAALAERLPDPAARNAATGIERSLYGPQDAGLDAAALRTAVRLIRQDARRPTGIIRCALRKHAVPSLH